MSNKDIRKDFSLDMSFDEALGRYVQSNPDETLAVQNEDMPEATIDRLIDAFEACAQKTEDGFDYWLARDLPQLLEYGEWRNFLTVIDKSKTACRESGNDPEDHFVESNKMIGIGKGAQRNVTDYMMSRYACYLTAQNGDARKKPVDRKSGV